MRTRILIPLVILFCTSCNNNSNDASFEEKKIFIDLKSTTPIKLSDISESNQLIKLQTTDQSIFKSIRNIEIFDNKIFINDGYSVSIFDYNRGLFINKLNKRGKGPTEYLSISGLVIDPMDSTMIISDMSGQSIIYYSFKGEFIKRCKLGYWAGDMHKTNTNNLLLYSGNRKDEKQSAKLTLVKNCEKIKDYMPVPDNRTYINAISNSHFYSYNDTTLFFEPFNDTIYSFVNDKLAVRYAIDFSGQNIDKDIYDGKYSDVSEFIKELKRHNYAYGINSFIETERSLFFSFKYNKRNYAIYDKKTNSSSVFTDIIDDVNFSSIYLDVTHRDFNIFCKNGNIIYAIQPKFIIDNKENITSTKLLEIAESIKGDDNYILCIAKVK